MKRVGSILVVSLCIGGTAVAEPVALKLKYTEGRTLVTSTEATNVTDAAGMQILQVHTQEIENKVLQADASGALLRLTFLRQAMKTESPMGSMVFDSASDTDTTVGVGFSALSALVGKGFEVRLSSEGAVLELRGVEALIASLREAMPEDFPPAAVEGVVEAFNVDALTKQFEEEAELLPNVPVELGDAWSNSVVVELPGVGEMTTITDFTLKEIGESSPDVATITYSVRTELEEGNTLLDGFDVTGSGAFHLDMEAGYVMDNLTEVRLTGQVQGMPMTVTSRTSMEQVLR